MKTTGWATETASLSGNTEPKHSQRLLWLLFKVIEPSQRDWKMIEMRFPSLTGERTTFVLIEKETTLLSMKFEQVKLDFIERLTTCFSKFSLVYIGEDCFHAVFTPSYIYLFTLLPYNHINFEHTETHKNTWMCLLKRRCKETHKTKKETKMLKQRNKQVFHTGKDNSVNSFSIWFIYTF